MATGAADRSTSHSALDSAYLRSLFQCGGFAIVACDSDGRVAATNAAAAKLFGRDRADAVGIGVTELFPEAERESVERHLRACQNSLDAVEFEVRLFADSRECVYAVWITPVVEPDGSVRGVALWFRDITQRVALQDELNQQTRLASLGLMARGVAHHYLNLLTCVSTAINVAENTNTLPAARGVLARTREPIERATRIANKLLAFAKADFRCHDLSDLTESVLYFFDEHEARLKRQHVELILEWAPVRSFSVPREPMQLVLQNLVENAVEAMKDGGTLHVMLSERDGAIVLTLRDTGSGIPPGIMDNLFVPFCTTKGELSLGAPGSGRNAGLGLAVVYGLVGEMHGRITAKNLPERGACFEIIFPPDSHAPHRNA